MTFFEAAIEILKDSSRPLHYKKITELAINQSLLSHVGKTPAVTMEQRLKQEADSAEGPSIVCVRPGVFALAEGAQIAPRKETVSVAVTTATQTEDAAPEEADAEEPSRSRRTRSRRRRRSRSEEARPAAEVAETTEAPVVAEAAEETAKPAPKTTRGRSPEPKSQESTGSERRTRSRRTPTQSPERSPEKSSDRAPKRADRPERTRDRAPKRGDRPEKTRERTSKPRRDDDSMGALKRAHEHVVAGTKDMLAAALERLPVKEHDAFVSSTLKALGYAITEIEKSQDASAYIASAKDTLIPLNVAVLVWLADRKVTEDTVAVLRGRLHRYGATHGAIVGLRPDTFDKTAHREAESTQALPVILLDSRGFAPLATRAGVGIQRKTLDVPVLDERWFE